MSAPAGVELEVILTGRLTVPRAYAFRPSRGVLATHIAQVLLGTGEPLRSPCLAFAVRHPDAGTILVDTGFHADAATDLRRDFGTRMGLVFRSLEPAAEPFDVQLRGLGIDPAEVTRVLMTHLHVDHTSGMRLLPRARFTCSAAEWRAASGPGAANRGYVGHHLPAEDRVEMVDFAAGGEPYGPFARTVDWLGDGTVRLVSTPGHTRGHMSVLLRLGDGEALLVGDAAYTRRSIDEQILPLFTDPGDEVCLDSLRRIREYAAQSPGAAIVPSHDPDAWRG